jgi:tetratricopeptide (TPR) repeat protein
LKEQRIAAFKALRPVLTGNISKASVIWQSDDFSFGKKASISKIYISDFLNKKISEEKFIEHINLEMIEPLSIRKSFVESANIPEVSQENLIVSLKLRDKADLYRIDGNLESALRIYNQIINLNPGDYISLYWIGEIYKNQNKIDLAKEYLTKALSFSHDFKSADDALFEIILKDNSFSW